MFSRQTMMVASIIFWLAGCVTAPSSRDVPVVESKGSGLPGVESGVEEPVDIKAIDSEPVVSHRSGDGDNPAVIALLETARGQQQQHKYVEAAASLERAIRIAPRNARLYLQLAKVRLQQGRKSQAQQLCNKARALSGNDPDIQDSCYIMLNS